MEASIRRTANSTNKFRRYGEEILPPIRSERHTKMNVQRREKLGATLTDKFVTKFGAQKNRGLIQKEVNQFLKRERLNENDLKQFELSLHKKLNSKEKKEKLKENLITNIKSKQNYVTENNKNNNLREINSDNNQGQGLDQSRMSGASDLDKFDEKFLSDKMREEEVNDFKKISTLNDQPIGSKVNLDLSKYANEWDAINMYNKKKYEEQKRNEKIKNWEIRMQTRAELNNQIKKKIIRQYEQELKDREYDAMMDKHIQYLNELDEKKKEELKKRAIQEKEMRDKQMREQYVTKRIAFLKNKKYEKELVEHNKEEIRLEKEAIQARKKRDHEELLKTLKENELHKQKKIEQEKKEKENDVQMMEDALASELKKDNERKAYFEKIKKAGAQFSDDAVRNVYRMRDEKIKEEEEKMKQYLYMTNKLAEEEDLRRKNKERENKKMMKEFYDKQVKEKKDKEEYEHQINLAQGKIWNQDYKNYIETEKENNRIVRELAKRNLSILDAQVKMGKYDVDKTMSTAEREMNFEILRKAAEM